MPKVPKEGNPTIVTPWIKKIAAGLYTGALGVAADEQQRCIDLINEKDDYVQLKSDVLEGRNHKRIEWTRKEIWRDESGRVGYEQANINGEDINPGDYVLIRPKGKGCKPRPELDGKGREGSLAAHEQTWFGRVVYLFQSEKGEKCAHLRWFAHGKDTILGGISGLKELFLLTTCGDNLLETICGKIEVTQLQYGDQEIEDDSQESTFFYR